MAPKTWILPLAGLVWLKKLHSLARRARRKLAGPSPDGFAASLPRPVPKRIWIFWQTGEATAPPLVRACIDSWRQMNPGWEVTVLDQGNLAQHAEMPPPGSLSVQAYSDLLRLRLLRRRGGVWVDATCYCTRPLDHWLPMAAQHGFFGFAWTRRDRWFILPNVFREMTSWFLASEPQGAIVSRWEEKSFAYWEGRETAHVYYWVHMIFEYLACSDRQVRRAWREMPKFGAFGPHLVHDHVLKGRDPAQVRAALESGAVPLQKLRWNWDAAQLARAREVMPALPAAGAEAPEHG
ncbi:capsular polysaccharide synthesis protein [Poseidonocella sp. HB161398]|uniref:capsular polysaccharide synthesis protein n=1 Tax=Poseidonocella sp. HB161398 TaxID=2320855 RepID=UPI00148649B5|nr:capsular polysaccharide synthesis protein [Poseidonocella sp. HB161398]